VKPSVPCRRFASCKRSLNGVEVVISAKLPDNIPTSAAGISHDVADVEASGGEKWEHLKEAGESNGTCPVCCVPEPYQSPD